MVFRLAYANLDTYLYANDVERSDLLRLLDGFDYETFKAMQEQWLIRGRMMWFVYGNLTKEQAK